MKYFYIQENSTGRAGIFTDPKLIDIYSKVNQAEIEQFEKEQIERDKDSIWRGTLVPLKPIPETTFYIEQIEILEPGYFITGSVFQRNAVNTTAAVVPFPLNVMYEFSDIKIIHYFHHTLPIEIQSLPKPKEGFINFLYFY